MWSTGFGTHVEFAVSPFTAVGPTFVCRQMAARRGDGRVRVRNASGVDGLSWAVGQLRALERAERMRAYGADAAAAWIVAKDCAVPAVVTVSNVLLAHELDVGRWYYAFTGRRWDGHAASFGRAREDARRLARNSPEFDADGRAARRPGVRAYRAGHLLVERLDSHPNLHELHDYTRFVGWSTRLDVGYLHCDDND